MASSYYDKENEIIICGFGDSKIHRNIALTEGFTELLSMIIILGIVEINSGYYIEALLSKQLTLLVGLDTMVESYFKNHNTSLIEKELNKIENNEAFLKGLIQNIEYYYIVNNNLMDFPQTFLATSQNLMIYYLKVKLLKAIEENTMTKEEIIELLNNFEKSLITPEILKMKNMNPKIYLNIEKNNR